LINKYTNKGLAAEFKYDFKDAIMIFIKIFTELKIEKIVEKNN